MTKFGWSGAAAIVMSACFGFSNGASAGDFAVGVSASSAGVGPEVQYAVNPFLVARAGWGFADIGIERTIDDIRYDADVNFSSAWGAVNAHPFATGFMISGGAFFGDRTFDLDATPASPVEIGDTVFQPAEVGVLEGESDWGSVAPFLGIGYNNTFKGLTPVGFHALVGAMYIGEPDVTLEATGGLLANDPTFLAELAEEQDDLQDDLDDIPVYPVITLGISIRF